MNLARIRLYPIKALDGVDVPAASILASGALEQDRRFSIQTPDGKFLNGKRTPLVHALRATYSADFSTVTLSAAGRVPDTFELRPAQPKLEAWLSDFFKQPVSIHENRDMGFPDDTDAPGPTLLSEATLETVASWYPGLSVESVRARFRANLEVAGVPAFWEDGCFGAAPGSGVPFQIGTVTITGVNPCQRCIVPTRDAQTAEPWPQFQQIFQERRKATLPTWAARERFNHFYRLSLNTRIHRHNAGNLLRVGDPVHKNPAP